MPPATPPAGRTPRGFKFVERTLHDRNGGVWVGGALTFGETDVDSVDEMVDHILNTLGPNECIGSITLIAHGCPGNISVGNGDRGSERGKEISVRSASRPAPSDRHAGCRRGVWSAEDEASCRCSAIHNCSTCRTVHSARPWSGSCNGRSPRSDPPHHRVGLTIPRRVHHRDTHPGKEWRAGYRVLIPSNAQP
jgi:hypothetical protein